MSKQRDLVLAAVQQGISDPKAIVTWTGLRRDRVHTELGRLLDLKKVRKQGKEWIVNELPALTRAW